MTFERADAHLAPRPPLDHAAASGPPVRPTDGAPKRLWVIIVTYNGARWIAECVRRVSCPLVEQVVVVDNASADDTVDILRSLQVPIRVISLAENLGFGRANNIAVEQAMQAGAEYVLLLNQDAILDEENLSRLCQAMAGAPAFGILSAFWLDYKGSATDPIFRRLTTEAFWDDVFFERMAPIYETGVVPAACVLIRTAVFEGVGGFDPLFFMYCEDDDLCYRAELIGWRIGFVPRATVRHRNAQIQKDFPLKLQIEKQYSVAAFRLKASRRSFVLRHLGLIRFWLPTIPPEFRPRVSLILIRLRVLVRCLLRAGAILRSRRLMPRIPTESRDTLRVRPQPEDTSG